VSQAEDGKGKSDTPLKLHTHKMDSFFKKSDSDLPEVKLSPRSTPQSKVTEKKNLP